MAVAVHIQSAKDQAIEEMKDATAVRQGLSDNGLMELGNWAGSNDTNMPHAW